MKGLQFCADAKGISNLENFAIFTLANLFQFGQIAASHLRALSSVGRAPDLHSGGQEFDSPSVHHLNKLEPSSPRRPRVLNLYFAT